MKSCYQAVSRPKSYCQWLPQHHFQHQQQWRYVGQGKAKIGLGSDDWNSPFKNWSPLLLFFFHLRGSKRNPKLFFVSSTTTTLSTTTICYVSSGTPSTAAACGKRKRRALMVDSAVDQVVTNFLAKIFVNTILQTGEPCWPCGYHQDSGGGGGEVSSKWTKW